MGSLLDDGDSFFAAFCVINGNVIKKTNIFASYTWERFEDSIKLHVDSTLRLTSWRIDMNSKYQKHCVITVAPLIWRHTLIKRQPIHHPTKPAQTSDTLSPTTQNKLPGTPRPPGQIKKQRIKQETRIFAKRGLTPIRAISPSALATVGEPSKGEQEKKRGRGSQGEKRDRHFDAWPKEPARRPEAR